MSELIVDFPHSLSDPISKRIVHFANTIDINVIRPVNQDSCSTWYSDEDYKAMRIAMREAVVCKQQVFKSILIIVLNKCYGSCSLDRD